MLLGPEAFHGQIYKLCTSHCTNVPTFEDLGAVPKEEYRDRHIQPHILYYCMKNVFETHVRDTVLPSVRSYDEELLHQYNNRWNKYSRGITVVDHFSSYINRDLVQKQSNSRDIYTIKGLGLICWKEQLYLKIKKQMLPATLQQITRDRDGEIVNHGIFHRELYLPSNVPILLVATVRSPRHRVGRNFSTLCCRCPST